MRAINYHFILAFLIGILSASVLGEVELHRLDEGILLDKTILAGIEQVRVVILPPDSEPDKDNLLWRGLDRRVEKKLKDAGINVLAKTHIGRGSDESRPLETSDLKIDIDMLKLVDSQQYVFRTRTSLASKVYLTDNRRRYVMADIWKLKSVMRAVPAERMPAVVTEVVMEQVEGFIHSYLAANPGGIPKSKAGNATAVPQDVSKKRSKPAVKLTVARYNYVASKNSKVFHGPDCSSAARIKRENLVGYNSKQEAIRDGKRPCKRCKP